MQLDDILDDHPDINMVLVDPEDCTAGPPRPGRRVLGTQPLVLFLLVSLEHLLAGSTGLYMWVRLSGAKPDGGQGPYLISAPPSGRVSLQLVSDRPASTD